MFPKELVIGAHASTPMPADRRRYWQSKVFHVLLQYQRSGQHESFAVAGRKCWLWVLVVAGEPVSGTRESPGRWQEARDPRGEKPNGERKRENNNNEQWQYRRKNRGGKTDEPVFARTRGKTAEAEVYRQDQTSKERRPFALGAESKIFQERVDRLWPKVRGERYLRIVHRQSYKKIQ